MNQKTMVAIHEARGRLHTIKQLAHFHMSGENRFFVEKELEELSKNLNSIYVECLQCSKGKEDLDDAQSTDS